MRLPGFLPVRPRCGRSELRVSPQHARTRVGRAHRWPDKWINEGGEEGLRREARCFPQVKGRVLQFRSLISPELVRRR